MNPSLALLSAAEDVVRILKNEQIDTVVIGAIAMAAHQYVRQTHDIDLGVNANIHKMRKITAALKKSGYDTLLNEPDGEDPLSGVIDVRGKFGLLQIVSFADTFPAVIKDAISSSDQVLREGSLLNLVPLPHLVVLKLYAGGLKSKADIVELLKRNPKADLDEIQSLCEKYRMKGFQEIRRELDANED